MELSANRRYTSKLVLEDTTIVFQKTKGERTEQKKIHALLEKARSWEIPKGKALLSGWPWDHSSPCWLEVPCHTHLAPYKCHPDSCATLPPVQFCIAGPVNLQVSPLCCLVARELCIAAEELCGPGGPRNSRHGLEADWRLWRNFNCTSGKIVISAIVIGKTLLHRFT